ncbi:hypothetical protein HHX47_DHR6000787, partial [Lentinula edodes]
IYSHRISSCIRDLSCLFSLSFPIISDSYTGRKSHGSSFELPLRHPLWHLVVTSDCHGLAGISVGHDFGMTCGVSPYFYFC